MFRYLYTIVILFFVSANCGFGQYSVTRFPVRFGQYYNNFTFINPAYAGFNEGYEATAGSKRMLGNISKISTHYLGLSTRLRNSKGFKEHPFSALSFQAYADKEGVYINRNRIYGSYAWHTNISPKLMLSIGFHIGAINYYVKGTELSGDGSDWEPDGSVGVLFYNDKFATGISVNQMFKAEIQPLEEVAVIPVFVNYMAYYKLNVGSNVDITPMFNCRIPQKQYKGVYDVNVELLLNKTYGISLGIIDNNNVINTLVLRNIKFGNNRFGTFFSYIYPYKSSQIKINYAELGVNLLIAK